MSSFVIKIIAIVSMLIDHSSDALIGYSTPLNFIGRIAFPLFCFQLVIGYAHTRDIKNYCIRLAIFALISQIPFSIMIYNFSHNWFALNVFFTLLLGVFCMIVYDSKKISMLYKVLGILGILAIAHFANVDYQALGVLIILIIHVFYTHGLFRSKECATGNSHVNSINNAELGKSHNNSTNNAELSKVHNIVNYETQKADNSNASWYLPILFIIVMLIFSILRYLPSMKYFPFEFIFCFILFTFIPTFIMLLYNGKKGPSLKYFFYVFYPAHIILLNILHSIFIG